MKHPLTPAGIEPATFRFAAYHLSHCATAVPITQLAVTNSLQTFRDELSVLPSRVTNLITIYDGTDWLPPIFGRELPLLAA